jgi:glycosyltransferase involved in cell wall biosynthesis
VAVSDRPDEHQVRTCRIAVFATGPANRFRPTLQALRRVVDRDVVVGAPDSFTLQQLGDLATETILVETAAELVNALRRTGTDIFVITDPVLIASDSIDRAERIVSSDLRVATVSAFCNAAGYLSFPERNCPMALPPAGHDEGSLSRRLRELAPNPTPVPIPMATGPAVMVGATALDLCRAIVDGPSRQFSAALADLCFRARHRGFLDLLDPGTFHNRPSDLAPPALDPAEWASSFTAADESWLEARHPADLALLHREAASDDGPLGSAFHCARSKILGLRILIDGSFIGPHETGTQVATLATIDALASRDDVDDVTVAIGHPMPPYARTTLTRPKVRTATPAASAEGQHADVLHRPLQPDSTFSVPAARSAARRVVVSILDLIAYQIGAYHGTIPSWFAYREVLRDAARHVDAVATISHDVAEMIELEGLAIERDRLYVIPYGTEHLTGDEKAVPPARLLEHAAATEPFLLCLGTNYSHKNRDLALGVAEELRRRGRELPLVLAGPAVPYGSTRIHEADGAGSDVVCLLPDVTTTERNWLLRHASVVMYPTSAEGFGFVPFEAAQFGTPALHVAFGPLVALGADLPVSVVSWEPGAFADGIVRLLDDPSLATAQVEAFRAAGERYTWPRTAEQLVLMYRTVLGMPARETP